MRIRSCKIVTVPKGETRQSAYTFRALYPAPAFLSKGMAMRPDIIRIGFALALAVGASEAAWAQSANGEDRFAPPSRPARTAPSSHRYHRRCSLDQRAYAYINACGELIPGMWDWFVGSG
jgi:hypothetical protein